MAQNAEVQSAITRFYRTDHTALRYKLSGISDTITYNKFYAGESMAELTGIADIGDMLKRLEKLRSQLAQIAVQTNPKVAELIQDARKRNFYSKSLVAFLLSQADKGQEFKPQLNDPIAAWFKPLVCNALANEGINDFTRLKAYIEARGNSWYKGVARIGQLKAKAIERWFMSNVDTLGAINKPVINNTNTAIANITLGFKAISHALDKRGGVSRELDGSNGINRDSHFSLIQANNDLQAVEAYLYKYREQDLTHDSYKKELERFLLWCVCERNVALSSVLVPDCEAYKDFLKEIPLHWIGPRRAKRSSNWKPFAGQLSVKSQVYAIQALRAFFAWLVEMRYLAANPWRAVSDPKMARAIHSIQIEKALPKDLWQKISEAGGQLDQACEKAIFATGKGAAMRFKQMRLARAAILLMGFSGIRLQEVCNITFDDIKPVDQNEDLYSLMILGKRQLMREVFVPKRVVDVLADHWRDRGLIEPGENISAVDKEFALIAPVHISNSTNAQNKYNDAQSASFGYTPRALSRVIRTNLHWMITDTELNLTDREKQILFELSPHDLRHTFATLSVAADSPLPLEVAQSLLGHASLQTTSIYIQAERKRSIQSVRSLFGDQKL